MIAVPKYFDEGVKAAHTGGDMSSLATPMGFTFCPYADGSAQRHNFLEGCVAAYFDKVEGEKK